MTTSMRRSVVPHLLTLKVSLTLLLLSACEPTTPRGPSSAPTASSSATLAPSAAQAADSAELVALYDRARTSLDPVDLRALGRAVPADRLVAALSDPERREVARRALLLLDDVDEAFLPLARRAADPSAREEALALFLELTNRPPAFGERLAPEDDAETLALLEALLSGWGAPPSPETIVLAESLIARLRARGLPGP